MSERIINILIVVLIVIIGAIAGRPRVYGNRASANRAACQKTMKAVFEARDMAIADGECNETSSMKEAIPLLVEKGYLSCLPADAGASSKVNSTYHLLHDGRLFCINHGIYGVEDDCGVKSPRQQLAGLNVDAELIERSSTRVLSHRPEYYIKKRAQHDAWCDNIIKLCGGWLLVLFVYSALRPSSKELHCK